jgi:hypothetical protein
VGGPNDRMTHFVRVVYLYYIKYFVRVVLYYGGVWFCGLKFSLDHIKRLTFK